MRNKYWQLLSALALLLMAQVSFAATNLAPFPKFTAFDANGDPLVGGQLFTYIVGTTTPKTTHTTEAATAENTNPVILNSFGQADVWLTGCYTLVLWDINNVVQWTVDEVCGFTIGEITSGTTGQIAVYTAASQLGGVSNVSGASVVSISLISGTLTASQLPDPIESAVSGIGKEITGAILTIDLTSNETISGNSLYGAHIGNWGATSSVTATLDAALKGMSVFFIQNQGQASGQTIFVKLAPADQVVGLIAGFQAGTSVVQLSGTTLGQFMFMEAFQDGRWFISSVSNPQFCTPTDSDCGI